MMVTKRPEDSISLDLRYPEPKAIALGGVLIGSAIEDEHINDIAMANIISP